MATRVDSETVEMWPTDEDERALNARLQAAGVQLPTTSLVRPREIAKARPAWLAFLLARVGMRRR